MSQENVEIVREAYRVLAKGVDERPVTNLVEAGLLILTGEIDFRTAYPDGQVLRLAGVTEFFDTQPVGSLVALRSRVHQSRWDRPSAGIRESSRGRQP